MRLICFVLSCQITFATLGAELNLGTNAVPHKYTNVTALVSGPNDANIAKVIPRILEKMHYLRKPFDSLLSSNFFARYLDALDNLHIYFLQSDVQDFEGYRYTLDVLTKNGDTTPARVIFNRFRERLDQQFDYVMELLKTEQFEFTGDERYVLNRKELPRPKDLNEAKQLWRDRLRYEYLQEKLNKEKPEEIVKIITRRYNRVLRFLNDYDDDDVLQAFFNALAHCYDPHSDYMGKSEYDNFSINMKLSLYGIGALLRSEDGICRIQSLTPNGPAEKSSKLKANDKIIAVAQSNQPPVDVLDMPLRKVVELIRGPKETEVRLTIIPADASDPSARKVITLVRGYIPLEEQAAKAKIYEIPVGNGQAMRLGVIDLPSFYSSMEMQGRRGSSRNGGTESGSDTSTTTDVARLIEKLTHESVAGIILDLRRNGGGSLEEAISLTGLFINEGPVVQVKDTDGNKYVDNDPNDRYPGEFYKGPLVVLTSRFSASASEILAGALQDYDRALIVGDASTHGKGTVQSLIQLTNIFRMSGIPYTNDPGAMKVTIRKFYRAGGGSTQKQGVIPDIVLPSIYNEAKVGEASLDNPLEYDTIPGAPFDKMNRISPYGSELKKRSEKRIAADPDFAYLADEITRSKKMQDEKSVAMNEALRLKEKKEADERAKKRKKELAARPEPPGKVYEITLKIVDQPGLPAPMTKTNVIKSASASGFRKTEPKTAKADTETSSPEGEKAGAKPAENAPADSELAKTTEPDEEAIPDDRVPNVDITLDEAKRILMDLITLSSKHDGLAVTIPAEKK